MHDILERISIRSAELGTNDTAISKHAGSRDLIRNWRRSAAKNQAINARMVSLQLIADALNVPLQWLVDGDGYGEPSSPKGNAGFSESAATLWQPAQTDSAFDLAKALAPQIQHPQFFTMARAEPFLGLLKGDTLIVEANHRAKHGDTVIANTYDEAGEVVSTLVRRWLPPYLFSCNPDDASASIIIDDTGRATIFGTIEASYRTATRS